MKITAALFSIAFVLVAIVAANVASSATVTSGRDGTYTGTSTQSVISLDTVRKDGQTAKVRCSQSARGPIVHFPGSPDAGVPFDPCSEVVLGTTDILPAMVLTATNGLTFSGSSTSTTTVTSTSTSTTTATNTSTSTVTNTATSTATVTNTNTDTLTDTNTATVTNTDTDTITATQTNTATSTVTSTVTTTGTDTGTVTVTGTTTSTVTQTTTGSSVDSVYAGALAGGVVRLYLQTGGTGSFSAISGTDGPIWRGIVQCNGNVYAAAATGTGNDIYMQTGGTGSFAALGQTARNWRGMACLGSNVYAAVSGGDIYMQTGGSGDFAALSQTSRTWTGMTACNGNVYAAVSGGDIYMQTGGSGDFAALSQTSRDWRGMACSGSNVYASVYNGDLYMQTGGTGNFAALSQTSRYWYGMAEANGNVYAAVYGGDIYMQTAGTGDFAALSQTSRSYAYMGSASVASTGTQTGTATTTETQTATAGTGTGTTTQTATTTETGTATQLQTSTSTGTATQTYSYTSSSTGTATQTQTGTATGTATSTGTATGTTSGTSTGTSTATGTFEGTNCNLANSQCTIGQSATIAVESGSGLGVRNQTDTATSTSAEQGKNPVVSADGLVKKPTATCASTEVLGYSVDRQASCKTVQTDTSAQTHVVTMPNATKTWTSAFTVATTDVATSTPGSSKIPIAGTATATSTATSYGLNAWVTHGTNDLNKPASVCSAGQVLTTLTDNHTSCVAVNTSTVTSTVTGTGNTVGVTAGIVTSLSTTSYLATPSLTTNYLPYWNGTGFSNSAVYRDASNDTLLGPGVVAHDGGDKILGFGWAPGTGLATVAGKPAELRWGTDGRLRLRVDSTSRSVGAAATMGTTIFDCDSAGACATWPYKGLVIAAAGDTPDVLYNRIVAGSGIDTSVTGSSPNRQVIVSVESGISKSYSANSGGPNSDTNFIDSGGGGSWVTIVSYMPNESISSYMVMANANYYCDNGSSSAHVVARIVEGSTQRGSDVQEDVPYTEDFYRKHVSVAAAGGAITSSTVIALQMKVDMTSGVTCTVPWGQANIAVQLNKAY